MMIIEKLLLHVLIVLAPILIHSLFFSDRQIGRPSYFIGILHGLTGSLCLLFAYESFGLFWDLRYVPLVLATLYGGMRGGLVVLAALLLTRTYLGGDALLFGYLSALLAAAGPMLIVSRFNKAQTKWKRVRLAILAGLWPAFVQLGILLSYIGFSDKYEIFPLKLLYFFGIFALIQVIGSGFAALLHEASIEKYRLREEIFRSEKLNTLGEMAASIAHEVRNPLTVVKGFLQLMQADDRKGQHTYLPLVLSELDRAESIISDYLNFAKPQLEKLETFELGCFLRDVVQLLNPLALKKGIVLSCQTDSAITLETDQNQLRQAIVNLIKNAIEATPEEGSVTVSMKSSGSEAEIMIADTGTGMTKEQLAKLGSLFYTTKETGTGLGTMVSLGIIDAMGGKTVYSSQPGKGTVVKICLQAKAYSS